MTTKKSRQVIALPRRDARREQFADAIVEVLGRVPSSLELPSDTPLQRAQAISRRAATKAALTAGGLALPVGPLGWLTVLPELLAVWRLQAQMVADIAAIYGVQANLSREQMVYCLFRHTAAQALRDVVARVGERWLVRQLPLAALQRLAGAIGVSLSRRAVNRSISRWLPIAGAVGVGAYAWIDTKQVANTAIALFADMPLTELPSEGELVESP